MLKPILSLSLCALAIPAVARADTFDFSAIGSGGGFSGSGSLVATNNNNGSFTITSISGTGVTGLITPGGFYSNDNSLLPGSTPQLTSSGFAFTDTLGGDSYSVNISSTPSGYQATTLDSSGDLSQTPVTFSLGNTSVSPEPASFLLLGSGLAVAAAGIRRRLTV